MSLSVAYAEFDIFCIIIMVMITLKAVSLTRSLANQRLYLTMMGSGMLLVFADLFYELDISEIIKLDAWALYACNILYFIASIVIAYLWFVYAQNMNGVRILNSKWYTILTALPAAVLIAMSFTTYYTKWAFYFDEEGYHRGTFNDFYMIVPLAYFMSALLVAVLHCFKEKTEMSVANFKIVLLFSIFPIAAVGLQFFFIGYPAVCVGASLGMLAVFLNNIAKDREELLIHETAAKSKNEFFAGMSHEIRTPINAILGMNTMILREAEDENIRGYAKNVDSSGKLLLRLVNDILDISKIEAGKMNLSPVTYETEALIDGLIKMISSHIEEKRLKLILDIDRNLPSKLYGDEIRLGQIILNILTNAAKYTQEGSVTLTVRAHSFDGDILKMYVGVKDTGSGMTKAELENLFSPYERFGGETNRKVEGTGLGMSISKKLLNLMGSYMDVESEYGKGSTFSFIVEQRIEDPMPIGDCFNKDKSVDSEENAKKDKAPIQKYKPTFKAPLAKILSVDDTVVNLRVFTALLKNTEMQIDIATSGREAIEMVKNTEYDIIFIDIMMPEMDGVETLSHMRSEDNFVRDNTPMIALTANALSGAKEEYLDEGFNDYLSKPIEVKKLESIITKYLPSDKVNM